MSSVLRFSCFPWLDVCDVACPQTVVFSMTKYLWCRFLSLFCFHDYNDVYDEVFPQRVMVAGAGLSAVTCVAEDSARAQFQLSRSTRGTSNVTALFLTVPTLSAGASLSSLFFLLLSCFGWLAGWLTDQLQINWRADWCLMALLSCFPFLILVGWLVGWLIEWVSEGGREGVGDQLGQTEGNFSVWQVSNTIFCKIMLEVQYR